MRSPTGGGTSSGPRKRRVVEARSGDVEASGHPERVGIRAVGVHSPRNTNGIALGMKRYRLLSINVMSPTEEGVWMPSGNGPSTNGAVRVANSSRKAVDVSRRTRLTTIPPPYHVHQAWTGRKSPP